MGGATDREEEEGRRVRPRRHHQLGRSARLFVSSLPTLTGENLSETKPSKGMIMHCVSSERVFLCVYGGHRHYSGIFWIRTKRNRYRCLQSIFNFCHLLLGVKIEI